MKETLQLVAMPFVLAALALGFFLGKTKNLFKRNTKKAVFVGLVLVLLAGWLGTGFVVVPPQTVKVVRYPDRPEGGALVLFEKPKPIINSTDGIVIRYAWPRVWWVPGIGKTNIGLREESYSLKEPVEFTANIELFPVYYLTEDPADQDKVAYLVVSGTFEVTDWDAFLANFDPKMLKEEFQNMSRSEIAAYSIGASLYEENIGNWYSESISRTYLADKFAREYNLKNEEEIEYFIKVYRPWYWAMGAMYFHRFEEEVLRNPFPNPYVVELSIRAVYAANAENTINNSQMMLKMFEAQKAAFYEDLDPAVIKKSEETIAAFKSYLKEKNISWPPYEVKKELSEFLIKKQMNGAVYSDKELYAFRTLAEIDSKIDYYKEIIVLFNDQAAQAQQFFRGFWTWNSAGNDALWKLAIKRAVEGKDFPTEGDFYPWLKTYGVDYFTELANFYQDSGLSAAPGVKFRKITFEIQEKVPTE